MRLKIPSIQRTCCILDTLRKSPSAKPKHVITASFRLNILVELLKPRGTENTEGSAFKNICFRTKKSHLGYCSKHYWKKHYCYSWQESGQRAAIRQERKKKNFKKSLIDMFSRQKCIFSSAFYFLCFPIGIGVKLCIISVI